MYASPSQMSFGLLKIGRRSRRTRNDVMLIFIKTDKLPYLTKPIKTA